MDTINIEGLDRADVLRALYNRARPQGMGFLHYDPEPMTRETADELLASWKSSYFDYVVGRVMKVDLGGADVDPRLYDRDNGPGAAAEAITTLRATGDPNHPLISTTHRTSTLRSAAETREAAGYRSTLSYGDGYAIMDVGMPEEAGEAAGQVADEL